MSESFRNTDTRFEKQLSAFMDECLYSKLRSTDGHPIRFERKDNQEDQLNGIDVIIYSEDREIIIDEKSTMYYSNAMIPTFAFELDSIQKGHKDPVEGWFINDNLKTEYYMLIWPNVKCVKEKDKNLWVRKDLGKITKYDFTIVEAMLIKKLAIRELLERMECDKDHLVQYAKSIRAACLGSKIMEEQKINDGIKITFSGYIAERPVNVVVAKKYLLDLAERVYLVAHDGYSSIKR